jgi:hypothetical protein
MARPLYLRKPRAAELRRLHQFLEGPLQPWQRRRAEALLLYAAGLDGQAIASLQKTRGRFYLFLAYEVNRGIIHWCFQAGKGAVYVGWFLRRLRRWYQRRAVRVALDRDPAHPCKSRATRRLMQKLGL